MGDFVIGLDLGSTYLKAVLVDRSGVIQATSKTRTPYFTDAIGSCELDPTELRLALESLLAQLRIEDGDQIDGLSYGSQANTFLVSSGGEPRSRFISWQDRRALPVRRTIQDLWLREERLWHTGTDLSGLEYLPPRLDWALRTFAEPHDHLQIRMLSDVVMSWFSAHDIGDESCWALSGLLSLPTKSWWTPALRACGLTESSLPRLSPTGTTVNVVPGGDGIITNLRTVTVGGLDHAIAVIGAAGVLGNRVGLSLGTVLATLIEESSYLPRSGSHVIPGYDRKHYLGLAFTNDGMGIADELLRELPLGDEDLAAPSVVAAAARKIPPGCHGLTLRRGARTLGASLTLQSRRRSGNLQSADTIADGSSYRAVLESLSASVVGLLGDGTDELQPLVVTGGGSHNQLLLEIIADMTGRTACRIPVDEPGAYGAATVAAVGAGWFETIEAASKSWARNVEAVEPDPAAARSYRSWLEWYLSTEPWHPDDNPFFVRS